MTTSASPRATTRAARARAGRPTRLSVEELPLPEPASGEVRLRVEACGICGTDLHLAAAGLMAPGHVPGHEMAGVVERVGPDVECVQEGARVAVEPLRSCGSCEPCLAGRDNICRSLQLHGIHLPGGFARHVLVPARRLFPVAGDLPAPVAALAEPVAVAVHGLRRGGLADGQRVLVLGAGAVGLFSTLAAGALGAGEVWASARHEHQAELARACGAARVLAEEEATPEALGRLARRVDFDLVVETVGGGAETLRAACHAIRPGGTVSVLGLFLAPVAVDPYPLLLKEGTLAWSNCYDRRGDRGADFADAVRLLEAERERLARLTTHQLPLDRIDEAFATAADKRGGAVKVTVLP